MSLLTDLIGGFLGAKSDSKANKVNKEQLKIDKDLANRQIEISKYIEGIAKQIAGLSGNTTDYYGTEIFYNPQTGKYEMRLGDTPKRMQDVSDAEDFSRLTVDQQLRRRGLQDYERMRARSSGQATREFDRLQNFRQGVGKVDADRLGSQIRADRTRAVNAGFDDAERSARTLQLRTGSSAVGSALSNLARDRVRAQASIGSPEVEALEMAEGINRNREQSILDSYGQFGNEGRAFYDAAFTPNNTAGDAYDRIADLMKFDLSKYDLAMGGSGSAASTIGNAARGLREGTNQYLQNRIASPWGNFVASGGRRIDEAIKQFLSMGGGG